VSTHIPGSAGDENFAIRHSPVEGTVRPGADRPHFKRLRNPSVFVTAIARPVISNIQPPLVCRRLTEPSWIGRDKPIDAGRLTALVYAGTRSELATEFISVHPCREDNVTRGGGHGPTPEQHAQNRLTHRRHYSELQLPLTSC